MKNDESMKINDDAKKSVSELFDQFGTTKAGLSQVEAGSRLSKYGPNTIQQAKRQSEIIVFFRKLYVTNGNFVVGVWDYRDVCWHDGIGDCHLGG